MRLWHLCLLVVVSAILSALARLLDRTQATQALQILVSFSIGLTGVLMLALAIRIGWVVEGWITSWARLRGGRVGGCVRELSLLLTLSLWLGTLVLVGIFLITFFFLLGLILLGLGKMTGLAAIT